MRPTTLTLIALAALVLPAGFAHAHFFPKRAKSLKASLVQNYPPCTTPGAVTSNGKAACEGPAEADPSCVFSAKGLGSFAATIKGKTSIHLKARLTGIDSGCEGKTLTAALRVRTTSDSCPNDHCTSVDEEITAGSCTVRGGKCKLDADVAPGYPSGAGAEMTVLSCGVKNGSLPTFTCGIMIP